MRLNFEIFCLVGKWWICRFFFIFLFANSIVLHVPGNHFIAVEIVSFWAYLA